MIAGGGGGGGSSSAGHPGGGIYFGRKDEDFSLPDDVCYIDSSTHQNHQAEPFKGEDSRNNGGSGGGLYGGCSDAYGGGGGKGFVYSDSHPSIISDIDSSKFKVENGMTFAGRNYGDGYVVIRVIKSSKVKCECYATFSLLAYSHSTIPSLFFSLLN